MDVLSDNSNYTLKSTKNIYRKRYNVMQYFSSFCRTEQKKPLWKEIAG